MSAPSQNTGSYLRVADGTNTSLEGFKQLLLSKLLKQSKASKYSDFALGYNSAISEVERIIKEL